MYEFSHTDLTDNKIPTYIAISWNEEEVRAGSRFPAATP